MGRIQNTLRSSAFGVLKTISSILGQFLVRTLLIWRLGNEYVGLDSLFTSILNVLNLTELGFGSAMCFAMYKPIAQNNIIKLNALANLNKKICEYIGIFILILGVCTTPILRFIINKDVPKDINIYVLYCIFLFNSVVSYFLYAYTIPIVNAYQRNDIQSKASIFTNLIKYLTQVFILFFFKNYWLYVILIPITTIADNLVRYNLMKRELPSIKTEGSVSINETNEIKKQVYALFGHRLNGTIINSADNIVISAFLGLVVLGKYNNYYYILSALCLFFSVFYEAIRPSIGNSYILNNRSDNYSLFRNISFAMQWISGWLAICLLCLYQPFMLIWTGESGMLDFSTTIFLALLFYEGRNFDLFTVFKDAAGLWWEDRFRPYVASMSNLVVNILLVKFIGLNGVIISTIMTRVIISWPWINKVLFHNVFQIGMTKYTKEFTLNTMVISMTGYVTYMMTSFVQTQNLILSLLIRAIICIVLPNVIMLSVYYKTRRFEDCVHICKRLVKKG